MLLRRIGRALEAAKQAGTDPGISKFQVRAATVVESGGEEHVVVGGNTEYNVPEAVHGEVSVVNHVIARLGAPAAREVKFIAFYSQTCGYAPTLLILGNGEGQFRATTFEAAMPHPFSAARFNPEAIEKFLARQFPASTSR